MFVDVEPFLFDATVDAQAVQTLDAVEQHQAAGGCPKVDAASRYRRKHRQR